MQRLIFAPFLLFLIEGIFSTTNERTVIRPMGGLTFQFLSYSILEFPKQKENGKRGTLNARILAPNDATFSPGNVESLPSEIEGKSIFVITKDYATIDFFYFQHVYATSQKASFKFTINIWSVNVNFTPEDGLGDCQYEITKVTSGGITEYIAEFRGCDHNELRLEMNYNYLVDFRGTDRFVYYSTYNLKPYMNSTLIRLNDNGILTLYMNPQAIEEQKPEMKNLRLEIFVRYMNSIICKFSELYHIDMNS